MQGASPTDLLDAAAWHFVLVAVCWESRGQHKIMYHKMHLADLAICCKKNSESKVSVLADGLGGLGGLSPELSERPRDLFSCSGGFFLFFLFFFQDKQEHLFSA